MSKFKTCNSTDPNTCLDASKNQTFTGLRGRSRYLLKTSERSARNPSPAWTIKANGPRSLHSPVFAPGSSSSSGGRGCCVGLAEAECVALVAVPRILLDVRIIVEGMLVIDGMGGTIGDCSGTPSMAMSLVPKTAMSTLE